MVSHSLQHLAVIMDGNGRWAAERGLPRAEGHRAGMDACKALVLNCLDLRIPHLSVYAFSVENWARPLTEIQFLMNLLRIYARQERKFFHERGVRVRVIGDWSRLPPAVQKELQETIDLTANNTRLSFNLALSYGGRDEIMRAFKRLSSERAKKGLSLEDLKAEDLSQALDTAHSPEPDLLVRTSGEQRISNFLLWQAAYSEFYFTDVLWPDFDRKELEKALESFQSRTRRFGKLEFSQDLSTQSR